MKLTKLLILSIAVLFLSCGDEDDDPKPTAEGLVGTWAVTDLDYHGTSKTTVSGTTIETDFTGEGKNMDMITVFGSNPNVVSSEGSYTITLTTSFMGQTETQDYEFNEIITDGTWSLSGNTLTVSNNLGVQETTIVQQTNTTLKLKIDVVETSTVSGITVTTDVHGTYTFTKQ